MVLLNGFTSWTSDDSGSIGLIPLAVLCSVLYLSISIALLTACDFQKRSQPQQLTLCRSLHAGALQASVSEGLAQGPYVAAIELDSNVYIV